MSISKKESGSPTVFLLIFINDLDLALIIWYNIIC